MNILEGNMSASEQPTEKKRFIESSCLFTNKEDDNPFSELHIDDSDFLNDISERGVCPKCSKSRRYYCYECYVAVKEISNSIPRLKLPVKIDIIKHPKEVDGKSTSAHAAVLAPDDVRIFVYPDFPSYENEKILLIFPGKEAIELKDALSSSVDSCLRETPHSSKFKKTENVQNECYCGKAHSDDSSKRDLPFNRILFIDSTWRQTKKLYGDPRINKFPCAVLTSHKSVFWRHQRGKPESYLATIEAIYYFLVEFHQLKYPNIPYCGYYDNLLFFFKFMYYMIRTLYDPATLKAYQKS